MRGWERVAVGRAGAWAGGSGWAGRQVDVGGQVSGPVGAAGQVALGIHIQCLAVGGLDLGFLPYSREGLSSLMHGL